MDKVLGILGGGQLGRMLVDAANKLNIEVVILDGPNSPAKQVCASSHHVDGSYRDATSIRQLAARCDVITFEIEHVDTQILESLAMNAVDSDRALTIQPHWQTIRLIQDKYLQKTHLAGNGIKVAQSWPLQSNDQSEYELIREQLGLPFMLKTRREAYDGKGNRPIKSEQDFASALQTFSSLSLYAERWQDFRMELAVMIVKSQERADHGYKSSTMAYPVVETIHSDSICKLVYVPPRNVEASILARAQQLARSAVSSLPGRGIFGVEMFLLQDDSIILNEIAPRPHNSGHYTIEACPLSQFDTHLRAVLDLPISPSSLELVNPSSVFVMLNIIGGEQPAAHKKIAERALAVPGANVHLYGKGPGRQGRKMGHITLQAQSYAQADKLIRPLVEELDRCWIQTSRSDMVSFQDTDKGRLDSMQSLSTHNLKSPLVAITMGSDSDCSVLAAGVKFLEDLQIPYTTTITSAHRTPDHMVRFAKSAAAKGIKVIIAAAGGAAHLPGMVAANTWLPVIGVPVRASVLDGLDSLLSIVQMPRGCPVSTVAINNSQNAAQIAARILAVTDTSLQMRLAAFLKAQEEEVLEKARRMEHEGFLKYNSIEGQ